MSDEPSGGEGGRSDPFDLPVLYKELEEQAARPRGTTVRVVYTVALFLLFLWLYTRVVSSGLDTLAALGQGSTIFGPLVGVLFAAVYGFTPAALCGVVNLEIHGSGFDLLRLTRLGPADIVLQKFLARLIPVLTSLLLALPVLAVTYTFGGVTLGELATVGHHLFWGAVQLGAIAIALSSAVRRPEIALVGTFLVHGVTAGLGVFLEPWLPGIIAWSPISAQLGAGIAFAPTTLIIQALWALGLSGLALTYAVLRVRRFAEAEPVVHPRQVETEARERSRGLPGKDPIPWRERGVRLCRPPVLAAVFVMIAGVALGLEFLFPGAHFLDRFGQVWILGLWLAGALLGLIVMAGSFGQERADKTMEVLMTTPMSGESIVRQKALALRSLWWGIGLMAVPWYAWTALAETFGPREFASLVAFAIDLPLIAWFGASIGMKAETPARATLSALVIGTVWAGLLIALGPLGIFSPFVTLTVAEPALARWTFFARAAPHVVLGWAAFLHLVMLIRVRRGCLKNADELLGRVAYDWWSRHQPRWQLRAVGPITLLQRLTERLLDLRRDR